MSRYACPRHGEECVLRSITVTVRGEKQTYEYYACPVKGCFFKRPNKWQQRRANEEHK